MKSIVLFLICTQILIAQEAVHNYGNLKIHDNGAIGFHHNLINDGVTDDNQGLAGFYSAESSIISGAFRPVFRDMEIMVANNIFLEVGIRVTNNSNFILGNVVTPKNLKDINVEYMNTAFYNGNNDNTKIDGYAAIFNKGNFTFPIGDDGRLRPLQQISQNENTNAKSAYFFEDPNTPSTFTVPFNTETRTDILTAISTSEFWDLDSETLSTVTLGWDAQSNIASFVNAIENIRVVGWHTINEIWEDLGQTTYNGDFNTGTITSDTFIPNDYSVITLGSSLRKENITLANYLLTPNNDGMNDYFVLSAVALSPNNELKIFNRWGRAVYIKKNYTNLFEGKSNVSGVIKKKKILPAGLYFYTIDLSDIDLIHQGYLYIYE